ncbi:MAG: AAA family ATPase, partial [Candidatus Woesearchaeota archaeon]|nr:AAA family ATPase [Candidatus Woesearchaeota archaeon]
MPETAPTSTEGLTATQLIDQCKDFLEKNYHAELLERVRVGDQFLVIDFKTLSNHDPSIADTLLDHPEEVLKACELAVKEFDLPKPITKFTIRVRNIPESARIMIRNVRAQHLGKLILTEGVARQKSDVRPQVTTAKFECPSCGNTISVLQLDAHFKEPTRCSCGRKGKFRMLSKELVDFQGIVLEEVPEQLEGGEQPKRLNVLLRNDLVSPLSEKRTNPGARLRITGIIKEIPIILRTGGQSTKFDLIIEANHIEPIEEDFLDITISPEELEEIKKISQDPKLFERMVSSIAPSIYGHDKIKEALILQLLGGVRKTREDGIVTRGDMHILLLGDPGAAKSQMLKRMAFVAPKA